MPLTVQTDPFEEAFLVYTDDSATNSIIFDAVTAETWTEPATVTEHPVEAGANVADHVRVSLITCSLTVRVSNEPLGSNQFADPLGEPFSPLFLNIKGLKQSAHSGGGTPFGAGAPFTGVVVVPTWINNLALSEQIGILAGIGSTLAGGVAQKIADATPLGNAFAAGLKPLVRATQTGNDVIAYPDTPEVAVGDVPIRSVGDLVGTLVYEGITSLVPPGQEVDVPTQTTAGMPSTFGVTTTVTPQTIQFSDGDQQDFAAAMIDLLTGLKTAAQQFTVYGSKRELTPMVIETLTHRRGAPEDTGTGVEITLGFKEVRLVSTNTVDIPLPTEPRTTPPVDKGDQNGAPAPTAEQTASVVLMGLEAAGVLQRRAAKALAAGGS